MYELIINKMAIVYEFFQAVPSSFKAPPHRARRLAGDSSLNTAENRVANQSPTSLQAGEIGPLQV